MQKKIYYILLVVVAILFSYEYSIKTIYGEWYIQDWGTEDGEYRIDSITELDGEDVTITDDTIVISPENEDPKIYIDADGGMQYLQINIPSIESSQDEFFRFYVMHNGKYSEKYSETRQIKEGNNVIWFDEPLEGRLRIDFEGIDSVNIHVKSIILDSDVQLVSEFIVCFILIMILMAVVVMMIIYKKKIGQYIHEHGVEIAVVFSFFLWFLLWSCILPYNSGPDEYMRYDVVKYIYQYRTLPRGDDPILCTANTWGVSYAYSPYLAYLMGAGFMYVAAIMGGTGLTMFHVARLISVLSSTITIVFLIKISKELKLKNKFLLPVVVGLLPEFTFISAYVNNDSLAIMSVAIIVYAWCIGLNSKWNIKSCIYLTIGMAVCVAAYYNCYGYLLLSFIGFVGTNIYWSAKKKDFSIFKGMLIKGFSMLFGTCLVSGWWFVRNYILYDGDILGNNASRAAAIKYAIDELNPLNKQSLKEQGVSLYEMLVGCEWITGSAKSFVASFGYLQFWIKEYMYWIVGVVIFIGIIFKLVKFKKDRAGRMPVLDLMLVCASVIVAMLSIIYSYTSDFQAQGRYLLPMLIPMMIFVCEGYDYLYKIGCKKCTAMIIVGAVLINFYSLGLVIVPAYYW